jgi:hypothetical protein|nr:hypothetical protein [Phenylobacterium sp.]
MKLQIAVALAALSIGGAAFAQEAPGGGQGPTPEMQAARQAMRQACAADAKTLCDGKMGREEMMCMRENADKISAPCKDAMSKMPRRQPPAPPAG